MGLIISATEEKKITIQGTDIEVPSIYGRIEFAGRYDGIKLDVGVATFASKTAYTSGSNPLSTDVPQGSLSVELVEGQVQSLETAHEYAKTAYEQQGYSVTIDLT